MTTPGISILQGKYMVTMDLFPQESKEFNQMYPFFDHLKEGRFTTTKCVDCGAEPFPQGCSARNVSAPTWSGWTGPLPAQ